MKNNSYSANQELEELFKDVPETDILLLDKGLGAKYYFKEKPTDLGIEIDAIIVHKNLFLIIDVKKTSDKDEVKKSFKESINLKRFNQINSRNFDIRDVKAVSKKKLQTDLEKFLSGKIASIKKKYAENGIAKIYFVPGSNIADSDTLKDFRLKYKSFVIDKNLHNYFTEIKKTLGAEYFCRELYGLLKISKYSLRLFQDKSSHKLSDIIGSSFLSQEFTKNHAKIFWTLSSFNKIGELSSFSPTVPGLFPRTTIDERAVLSPYLSLLKLMIQS